MSPRLLAPLLLLALLGLPSCSTPSRLKAGESQGILFLGLDASSNADLSLYANVSRERTLFIAWPRDTLAYIPGHGVWLQNFVHHQRYGFDIAKLWYRDNYGLPVDSIVVLDIGILKALAKDLKRTEAWTSAVSNFDYDQAWVRHRSRFTDFQRVQRCLTYTERLAKISSSLNCSLKTYLLTVVLGRCQRSDLSTNQALTLLATIEKSRRLYRIWPGSYAVAEFHYSFFDGQKVVYSIWDAKWQDAEKWPAANTEWVYSPTNFFLRQASNALRVETSSALVGVYTNYKWW